MCAGGSVFFFLQHMEKPIHLKLTLLTKKIIAWQRRLKGHQLISNIAHTYYSFTGHIYIVYVTWAAVRGNKGIVFILTDLTLIISKSMSLSLSLAKSNNWTGSGLFSTGLFRFTFRSGVSSLKSDVSTSGLICLTGLVDSLSVVDLVAGWLCVDPKVSEMKGLLNETFFLHNMGLLPVIWGSIIIFIHD